MPLGHDFESTLQAARLGTEWAWVRIYKDLSPAILRYLQAQGAHEPEDLLGEVFLRVVRSLPSFDGSEPSFRAWVFKTARNCLIDSWRHDGRRPVEYMPLEKLTCADESESAEAVALRHENYERVQATLSRLPDRQRDVIFLRVLAGLSVNEVAEVLGKSCGAVKSMQARGLAALHREIMRGAVSK